MDRSQVHNRTHTHKHTHLVAFSMSLIVPDIYAFGVTGETPHRNGENMQIAHIKILFQTGIRTGATH